MLAKSLRFTAVVVIILGLALALPCSDVFAQPRGGSGHDGNRSGGGPGESGRGWASGGRHYYRDGGWYRHGWLGFDIAVSALAIGALMDSLPPRHTTVVVAGTPYYYFYNYYYQPYPYGGYVVVPPPALAQPVVTMPQAIPVTAAITQSQTQIQEVSTINIPNSRGGYTAVTLKRAGTGYVGQQGEYYSDNPTVEQLKVLYGK
ncbi:MAG: hypothetical protein NT033_03895 [Candidatus Omnitrophica bacterium]|nr:hypothetical protein [Candidatus Omnitrophota bacterium]